jgi:ubiquinone/menaquinone biosynthesis C-methylase UbiE
MIRPGGLALTKKAIEIAALPEGARILDVGCGEGETVALLIKEYGFDVTGVDKSSNLILKGKANHENLDLRCMEAEFLDFDSKTFDAIIMECSLSVFRLQEEAVFEVYCLLKPGGKLIVTDMFQKTPYLRQEKEILDGAFVLNELADLMENAGFEIIHFEEVENALSNFVAQAIMDYGSLEEYFKAIVPEGADPSTFCACESLKDPKQLAYFLMIMKKPERR